jgi:hypothetical protein
VKQSVRADELPRNSDNYSTTRKFPVMISVSSILDRRPQPASSFGTLRQLHCDRA